MLVVSVEIVGRGLLESVVVLCVLRMWVSWFLNSSMVLVSVCSNSRGVKINVMC